jgi:hypothetical protein
MIYAIWSTEGSIHLLSSLFGSIFWILAAAIVWVMLHSTLNIISPELGVAGFGDGLHSQHKDRQGLSGESF